MKMSIILFAAIGLMASCTTITNTARTEGVPSQLLSATVADLDVMPQRVSYTLEVTKEIRRGGDANIMRTAEHEALVRNGNADLLVEPQYTTVRKRGLVRNRITGMTVTGRPAFYKGFHSLDDSVWCNREFRSRYARVR